MRVWHLSIKQKLFLSFFSISVLISALGWLNYYFGRAEAEHAAIHEAQSIAMTVAFDIAYRGHENAFADPQRLQDYIMSLKKVQHRDITVVDAGQRILADSVPDEIGSVFAHDSGDEVGLTISDGRMRTFVEISEPYPDGIKLFSMPLYSTDGERIGAVIMEYTPLYNEIMSSSWKRAKKFLAFYLAALALAMLMGYVIYKDIASPLSRIRAAVMRIASGDLDAKADYESEDELGELAGSFNLMSGELKNSETMLRSALSEKEVLLKEIHHRVKNNMAIITSLLRMQARRIRDEQVLEIFRESQNRIKSMAMIHERLYQDTDFLRIDFGSYVKSLLRDLCSSYSVGLGQVRLSVEAEDIPMGIDSLIPCGLIINELATNSLKYAFDGVVSPEIRVEFKREGEGKAVLTYSDNGPGMPEGMDINAQDTLGLQIVTGLVRQLGGELELLKGQGAAFRITFPAIEAASKDGPHSNG